MKKVLMVFGAMTAVVGIGVAAVRIVSNKVFPQPSTDTWPEFRSDVFTEMPMDSVGKKAAPAKKVTPAKKVAVKKVAVKKVAVKKVAVKKAAPAKRLVPVNKAVPS